MEPDRLSAVERSTPRGDGADRAAADAQARGNLTLVKLAFAQQAIDFLDNGGGKHIDLRISDYGMRI